jgi:hypothetical protein
VQINLESIEKILPYLGGEDSITVAENYLRLAMQFANIVPEDICNLV